MLIRICVAAALLVSQGPEKREVSKAASPQVFVQAFYDWYLPVAKRESKKPAFTVALKEKKSLFSQELISALQADAAAQEKATGEIVGLDWDPFLNAQDPGPKYRVGDTSNHGDCIRVPVSVVFARGRLSPIPSVIVELKKRNDGWMFTNFLSPDGKDLLTALNRLRKERQKDPHS
jgi:hypothetical protein